MKKQTIIMTVLSLALLACNNKELGPQKRSEDLTAKKMLQGIWINEDDQDVAFRVKGDTIFYPDSMSQPVSFQIFRDTFVIHGATDIKYPILRQTQHLFVFRNAEGSEVHLTLSDNKDDAALFPEKHVTVLNQRQLIKRDTVVTHDGNRYHAYVQVNPTTYKVPRTVMNDDGVAVDNYYYDNIINIHIIKGASKLFASNFDKKMFAKEVPEDFLKQAVFSDMAFSHIDSTGCHFIASLVIPDTMSSYEVDVTISEEGKVSMKID